MLISLLKKRLDWLTFRTSDNTEEIMAVVKLLSILDPVEDPDGYFTSEKGLERFWKYCERREAFERELTARQQKEEDDDTCHTTE